MAKRVVPETARRRRRPTKQGQVLTHGLIVATALRMLHEHGAAGLTARRLGLALGADASTVYRYFRGMDDLVLAIADELFGHAVNRFEPTGDWRGDLRELGLRIHHAYLAHPQAALLTASRVTGRPNEVAGDEMILGVLRGAGFGDEDAVRIYHAFIDQSLAFSILDAATLALPPAAREADEEVWRDTYARLPAATHPHIAATAPLLVARMNDSAYPTALDMLLSSAEDQLTRSSGAAGQRARLPGAARPGSG
ncbi:TetR/AcrR family transcriptional regulator [Nonomuraea sp. NPDC049421]|uniref:TetR/AcrR family transcriptional regulator n=1 Tax=Nonomuraea sp. NPDC049421 TaxID=3155275 RepID=UPI003416ED99